jgi:hypothetical protein
MRAPTDTCTLARKATVAQRASKSHSADASVTLSCPFRGGGLLRSGQQLPFRRLPHCPPRQRQRGGADILLSCLIKSLSACVVFKVKLNFEFERQLALCIYGKSVSAHISFSQARSVKRYDGTVPA